MKHTIRIAYGICSYMIAAALLLVPSLTSIETPLVARVIPFLGGAFLISTTIVTNFEFGLTRLLRFRDCTLLVAAGSLCVLLSVAVFDYGALLGFIVSAAALELGVSAFSFRTHYVNRHRLA